MHSPVERVLEQLTLVVGGRREGDSLRPDRLPHPSSHRPQLARWLRVIAILKTGRPTKSPRPSVFRPAEADRTPEIPQSTERGARGNPGRSFNGALKTAQDVCRVAAGIRKRELRCANPAFHERTGRPARRRSRRRSRRRARRAHVPHHANHVPRPGCGRRLRAHVRAERHPVSFRAQRGQRSAHATRPEQHEGDDALVDAKRGSGLA